VSSVTYQVTWQKRSKVCSIATKAIGGPNIYIFNETGFQSGVFTGKKVLVAVDCKAAYTADTKIRER
jgi:hypothetical protein